jgi:hypothetical protein
MINNELTHEWILKKHYAKRLPPISYAFGLYEKQIGLCGICTYGIPASRFEIFPVQPIELNRLIVIGELPKNTLSFFVSSTLKALKDIDKFVVVSYSDTNQGHHGYIYQATNWIYSGCIDIRSEFIIDGERLHCKTVYNKYGTSSLKELLKKGVDASFIKENKPKHRYFYVIGNKKFKKEMISVIKNNYGLHEYPKGDNKNYDIGEKLSTQKRLFFT